MNNCIWCLRWKWNILYAEGRFWISLWCPRATLPWATPSNLQTKPQAVSSQTRQENHPGTVISLASILLVGKTVWPARDDGATDNMSVVKLWTKQQRSNVLIVRLGGLNRQICLAYCWRSRASCFPLFPPQLSYANHLLAPASYIKDILDKKISAFIKMSDCCFK